MLHAHFKLNNNPIWYTVVDILSRFSPNVRVLRLLMEILRFYGSAGVIIYYLPSRGSLTLNGRHYGPITFLVD